jgi:FixJ family two-component response regulator
VDFLCKPVQPEDLLAAVREAVAKDATLRISLERRRRVRSLVDKLSPRERDVLGLVVQGLPNKVIAARLGRAQRTIKLHKQNLMEKMGARSAATLLEMLVDGDIAPARVRINGSRLDTRSPLSGA